MGVFQLTNQQGVSPAQAFNVPFSANYAANILSSNMNYLSRLCFPSMERAIPGTPPCLPRGSSPQPKVR